MKIKLLNLKIDLEGVEYRNYEDGSYQMNACTIIEKLYHEMPDDGYCMVCLTDIDLYNDVRVIKPRKWIYYPPPYKNDFCYELNSYKYWVSICSIARFDPLFSVDKKPEDNETKIKSYFSLLKRSAKVIVKKEAEHAAEHRAVSAGGSKAKVVINGEGVRLRFAPSLNAGYLTWENGKTRAPKKGARLEYTGEDGDWYQVKYLNHTFYVSKEFSYLEY
jgi:hypothetical protein